MARFSERYGYVKPNDVIVRECITEPIKNSIYNWFSMLRNACGNKYETLEKIVWIQFLNKKLDDFPYHDPFDNIDIICKFLDNSRKEWYRKLDLIEFAYPYIKNIISDEEFKNKIKQLNKEFERHNFAYRLIDGNVVEITAECEIEAIENAINDTNSNIRTHLQTALKHISVSQEPDYRNSIKESISAVECFCREITGQKTLDDAFKKMEKAGVILNSEMKKGFEKLYHYTNDSNTGIRHALMNDSNAPTADEAIFMLVSCSAFVNYLMKKKFKCKM